MIAAAATLGAVGAMLLLAEPAAACSCKIADIDKIVERGLAAAVVTNTSFTRSDRSPLRVEASYGADLPARIEPPHENACGGPDPLPGFVEAMLVDRKDTWRPVLCGYVDFGDTILRAAGEPKAVKGGRAVAVAAGTFGGSRLVALDHLGRPVAWDGQDGTGLQSAACPGGKVVASVGRTGGTYASDGTAQLTVHDVRTLAVRRSVPIRINQGDAVEAMRCADPRADRVEVLVRAWNGGERVRALIVTGKKVTTVKLGKLGVLTATPDGFVEGSAAGLDRLAADGTRTALATGIRPAYEGLAASADGRTIAVLGTIDDDVTVVRTIDARSGKVLGDWKPGTHVSGLAFTGSGAVLLRLSSVTPEAELRRFDRTMQPLAKGKAGPGWKFAAVGESGVSYKQARVSAARAGKAVLVADELRLAGAEHVVALSDAGFAAGPIGPDEQDGVEASVVVGDDDASVSVDVPLAGAVGGGLALAAATAFVVRRPSTVPRADASAASRAGPGEGGGP